MNKKNRSHQLILNQMKECLTKEGLPVFDDNHHCDYNPYRFSSRIQNDRGRTDILCWFDAERKYANIRVILGKCMADNDMSDIIKFANDVNGYLTLYHVAPCPDCGSMEFRSGLFVPGKNLPKAKFSWLLKGMIMEGELLRSMSPVPCVECTSEPLDGSSYNHRFDKVIDAIERVLNKFKLSIQNDFKEDKSFCIDVRYESIYDLIARVGIAVLDNPERVMLTMATRETVPEDKIPVIMELICRINQSSIVDHMYVHPDTHRAIVNKGILMTKGVLDVNEFECALKTIFGNGWHYLSMIREQLSSGESPKELSERMSTIDFSKHI